MKKRIILLMLICLSALLLLTACGESNLTPGTAEVTVKENGKKLTVTVAPDPEGLEKYEDSRIYLFALKPGSDISEIIKGDVKPIADKRAKNTVKFKLDVFDDDGKSRLYYGFIAAFFDSSVNRFVPAASTVSYLSNPEVLSDNDTEYTVQSSIKGINAKYDGDAALIDASHVIIDIPIEEYARTGASDGNIRYERNGNKRYISKSAISALDERVRYYTENGVTVYFRITLGASREELPEGLEFLACDGTVDGLDYYTLNTADKKCAEYVADILDFMAERYTDREKTNGLVSAFIAGHALNTPGDASGDYTYENYFEACTVLMRIMYTAMASHYENGRVFITVDRNYTVSGNGICDVGAKKLLSEFNAYTKASGDYPWGVALSTASASSDSDRVWYDNAGNGKYVTPVNLSLLTDTLMSSENYRYGGETRHIIISDFSVKLTDSDSSEKNQASSLAYAYYKAVETGKIDAFCYSSQVDADDGLRGADKETGKPTEKRLSFELYSVIDSDCEIDRFISQSMKKDSDWDKLYSANKESVATVRHSVGNVSSVTITDENDPTRNYNYNTLFDFEADSTDSFYSVGKDTGIKESKNALEVTFGNPDRASVGYVFVNGIKKSKISNDSLLVVANVGEGGGDSYTVTLTLIQRNDKKGDAVYVGSVSGVHGGESVLLDFDVSEFRRELESGKLEMRLSAYCEDNDAPSCKLSVERVLVGKAKSNTGLIILLAILAATAITLIVVLSVVWFRRNYKIERTPKNQKKDENKETKPAKKTGNTEKNNR